MTPREIEQKKAIAEHIPKSKDAKWLALIVAWEQSQYCFK